MATRVEVGSMTSLRAGPSLGDISKEETLKRTYFWQAGDTPGAPSTRIPEGKSPLHTSACLFPLPTLTPKPFSKEQDSEGKAPASGLRPHPPPPCPSTEIDKEAREDFGGRMPTLARQEASSGEALRNGPSLPSKAAFLRPGPSTMALFKSSKAGTTLDKGTSEDTWEANTPVTQDPPFSARPEVAAKPALPARKPPGTLPRPASLSQDIRSTASQEEAGWAQPLPKAGSVEDSAGHAAVPRPHPKRRPMSAVFSESLQPSKPGPGGMAFAGKVPPTPPEKTWVRKPRPLSMDLTAPFENREALLRKMANEQSAAGHQGAERANMEPKGDAEGPVHIAAPGEPDPVVPEVAKKPPEWKEKTLFKQKTDSPTTPGGQARATPREDQSPPQEEKARPDKQSEKVLESPMPRPRRGLGLAEVKGQGSDWEALAGAERRPVGSIRKRLSLFGEESAAALAEPAPATPESPSTPSPSTAPEPERAGINVQARIKVWAADSTEGKLEIKRRVPQARPLSADVTKLFSSSTSSNEARYEKCAMLGGELPGERREKPKEGHGLDGGPSLRSSWKPRVPQKSRQAELKDASNQNPDRCQGAHSRGDSGPSEITPEDDGSFQKVWATVFEHHVERHTVADQAGHCLSATPPCDVTDTPQPRPRPEKGSWLEKDPPGVTNPKRESHRYPKDAEQGTLLDAELRQYPTPIPETHPTGEKHSSRAFLKHPESPPMPQRIEPKYDFVHAEGKRAHSEAVSPAVEKAVLLRSKPPLSLQGRQLSGHTGAVHRASLIWEARGQEASGPKLDVREPRDMFGDGCPSPKWTGGIVANWHRATVDGKVNIPERGPAWDGPPDPSSKANSESRDSPEQAGLDTLSLQKGALLVTSESNERLGQVLEPETRMRRSSPSEPRMDRWRRRTLPHDVKFDVFSFLTPESTPEGQQRLPDDFTSTTGALKKPPLSPRQAQIQEVTTGASQSRALPTEKLGTSTEPRATFFAVTYQIPDIQKTKSIVKSGPEKFPEPSRKIPPTPSPHSSVSTLASPSCDGSQAPSSSKNLVEGREREEAGSSSDRPSPVGDRILNSSRDKIVDVDALWIHQKSREGKDSRNEMSPGSRDALGTAPFLRSRSKASSLVRRRTEVISETFPGKTRDGYRSSILDIDALMAQYKEQSARDPSKAQEWRNSPPVGPSSSPQEKPAGPGEVELGWRGLREGPQAEDHGKSVGASEKTHQSASGSSKPLAEPPGAAVTAKSGSSLWAPPSPSPVPAGPRKSSPGISEHENRAVAGEHQGVKALQGQAKAQDSGNSVRMPLRSPSSDQKKETPRRWNVEGSGAQWGDPPGDCTRLPLDIKRTCSEKGPPTRVREGLSAMQDARQRRQELPRGRLDLSTDTPKATAGSCWREPRTPDDPKVPLHSLEQDSDLQDSWQPVPQVCPVVPAPRRSHSFHKDRKSGLFVDQLKQCFSRRAPEAKDTDTLVHEADSQYGTWAEQRQSRDSLAPESPSPDSSASSTQRQPPGSHLSSLSSHTEPTSADQRNSSRDQRSSSVDRSSSELESTDGPDGPPDTCPVEKEDDFSFIHQTPVLDSSVLKTRVQLSKRSRRRAPISHLLRRSRFSELESRSPLEEELDSTWMFKDSTEEPSPRRDESDEEPSRAVKSPASHPHRMPVFPGMDPGVLKAQLQKRPEVESPRETLSWAPQPKTSKLPFQPGVLGSRVLPSSTEKEARSEEPSPQWLKELKSKKRQSLYENQA